MTGRCTWCGSENHEPHQHGGLVVRSDWRYGDPYPFMGPVARLKEPAVVTSYRLTEDEIEEVRAHTLAIIKYNTEHGYKDNWVIGSESDYELKFRGFAAEKAMSCLTGLPWRKIMFGTGFKEKKACDIGDRTEVRNIKKRTGSLAFKRKDAIGHIYLLTFGVPPGPIQALGWLEGYELREFPYLEPPRVPFAAHFAPQSALHPMPLPPDT